MGIMHRIRAGHRELAIVRNRDVRREDYLDAMTFQGPKHVFFREIFGPIVGLKDEWRSQGATDAELDLSAFRYRQALLAGCGVLTGYRGPDQSRMIEETDEHFLFFDERGIKSRLIKRAATIALPLEYPVKTADDWAALKPHYEFSEDRVPADIADRIRKLKAEGCVVTANIPGGFDEIRVLLGDEEAAVAGYTQPESGAARSRQSALNQIVARRRRLP